MYRFYILMLISVFSLLACTPQPTWRPHELQIDSKISKPLVIDEIVLSTEPTVFVRAMSYEASGAKDLDALIEKRLNSSKHRLVTRADTATIKLLAHLVYLGSAEQLDTETALAEGYGAPIPTSSVNHEKNSIYESVAIIDVNVIITEGDIINDQSCRVFIGSRRPMPQMSKQEIRAALLAKAADQISVFLEY